MRKKSKGFTIIELIITLALTTLTLGVIYTFFFSSNRTISTTEIGLALQTEGELIQKELIEIGTQAKEIVFINGNEQENESNNIKYNMLDTESKLDITSLQIKSYDDVLNKDIIYNFKLENKELKIQDENRNDLKVLSKNVVGFKIRPLDVHMVKDIKEANFKDTSGLEFTVDLEIKKAYSDVEYTSRAIVKFRNK